MEAPRWLIERTRLLNVFHYLRIFDAHSQMTTTEKLSLEKFAEGKQNALEIGTYMGVSANLIAKKLHESGFLHCVDPFIDRKNAQNPGLSIAKRDMRRNNISPKIKFLIGFSTDEVIQARIPNDLDFVFVDGDHSYEGLKNDWDIVCRKVKVGGIVCLHDTVIPSGETWRNFGSVKFFDEHIKNEPEFKILEVCHSMTVLIRNLRSQG